MGDKWVHRTLALSIMGRALHLFTALINQEPLSSFPEAKLKTESVF